MGLDVPVSAPVISVVIPTFNRGESLRATLNSILAQETGVGYEILVVDNNSSDATREVACSFSRVRYVFEGRQGLCHARNSGIENANGDVIAFVDDDVIADPRWLQQLLSVYAERPDAWCVGGKILLRLPGPSPTWFDESHPLLSSYLTGLDRGNDTARLSYPGEVWGANFSVSRAALAKAGGFRTDLDRLGSSLLSGGETELCWRIYRAGGGVYYCGRAIVAHIVPSWRLTPSYFRRRAYWHGRTNQLLGIERPSLKRILPLIVRGRARAALGRPVDRAQMFANTLEVWRYLGHVWQSAFPTAPRAPVHGFWANPCP